MVATYGLLRRFATVRPENSALAESIDQKIRKSLVVSIVLPPQCSDFTLTVTALQYFRLRHTSQRITVSIAVAVQCERAPRVTCLLEKMMTGLNLPWKNYFGLFGRGSKWLDTLLGNHTLNFTALHSTL